MLVAFSGIGTKEREKNHMKEYKGYGGGRVTIDGENIFIKVLFCKENCTFNDIKSVEFSEPTITTNGNLKILTNTQLHTIFFLRRNRDEFAELFDTLREESPHINSQVKFTATKIVGDFLEIDDKNKIIRIKNGISTVTKSYSDILDFELQEDNESVIKGGTGRALAGGLLFGGVGAIVGSATGNRKTNSIAQKMTLVIRLNDMNTPMIQIPLIKSPTKRNSTLYSLNRKIAEEAISVLNVIANGELENNKTSSQDLVSEVDKIRQYKKLLDDGIITVEEFDAKKKQLLGL